MAHAGHFSPNLQSFAYAELPTYLAMPSKGTHLEEIVGVHVEKCNEVVRISWKGSGAE